MMTQESLRLETSGTFQYKLSPEHEIEICHLIYHPAPRAFESWLSWEVYGKEGKEKKLIKGLLFS